MFVCASIAIPSPNTTSRSPGSSLAGSTERSDSIMTRARPGHHREGVDAAGTDPSPAREPELALRDSEQATAIAHQVGPRFIRGSS